MLTPAFSSFLPAVLAKKRVSGQVFPGAVSATVVKHLYLQLCQSGLNSLFIPTAASLLTPLVPLAWKAALQLCQGALQLLVPCHYPGTAMQGLHYWILM